MRTRTILAASGRLAPDVQAQDKPPADTPKIAADIPPEITTPDKLETRLGALEFKDGAPSAATVEKVYDNLDFTHALNAYLNCFQGASLYPMRQGFLSIGAEDNSVIIG
jgi:hypothetical protein